MSRYRMTLVVLVLAISVVAVFALVPSTKVQLKWNNSPKTPPIERLIGR